MNKTSTPKHGKKLENRLWSKIRRGTGIKREQRDQFADQSTNIAVATVCPAVNGRAEVRVYDRMRHGRRPFMFAMTLPHLGAARLYAQEHDAREFTKMLARSQAAQHE